MNGIGIDRWPEGMKEERQRWMQRERTREKEGSRKTKRKEQGGLRKGNVVGGCRECFLNVGQ